MTPQQTLGRVREVITRLARIESAPDGFTALERQQYIDAARARALDRIESLIGECTEGVSA